MKDQADGLSGVNRFIQMMRDVIRQRRLMEPRQQDVSFSSNGGKVFHAVDTDVIIFFTNTRNNAADRVNEGIREGYSQVFRADDKDLVTALGWKLADRIFLRDDNTAPPLFVLPPINEEVRGVFEAIHGKAETESTAAMWDQGTLNSILKKISESSEEEQIVLLRNEKEKIAKNLVLRLSTIQTARDELRNFRILAKRACLGTPEHLIGESKIKLGEHQISAFREPDNIEDQIHAYSLRDNWLERLRKYIGRGRHQINLTRDAHALARLEFVNEKLKGDSTDNSKLVLITGAKYIDNAALEYSPAIADGKSFAEAFLRHPRAYLNDVITPLASCRDDEDECPTSPSFILWLDTQLAEFCFLDEKRSNYREWVNLEKNLDNYLQFGEREQSEYLEETNHIIREFHNIIESFPDAVDKLETRWKDYLRSGSIDTLRTEKFRQSLSSQSTDREDSRISLSDTIQSLVNSKDFSRSYSELLIEDWRNCYYTAVTSGRGFLYDYDSGTSQKRSRCIPPIRFDTSFPEAAKFVTLLLEGSIEDRKKESELLEELENEDESGYTYFIANAQLFASQGAWSTAYGLAQWARDIAEITLTRSGPIQTSGIPAIDGREAAYLMAVTRRYTAIRVEHLDESAAYLSEYKRILDREKGESSQTKIAKSEGEQLLDDVRYDAERIGLDMSYHMFNEFCDASIPEEIASINTIITRLIHLFRKRFSELNAFSYSSHVIAGRITNCVGRLLVVYTINAILIKHFQYEESVDTLVAPMNEMLEYLDENLRERPMTSWTVEVLYRIACLWLGRSDDESDKRLKNLLSSSSVTEHALMPYDEARGVFYNAVFRELKGR